MTFKNFQQLVGIYLAICIFHWSYTWKPFKCFLSVTHIFNGLSEGTREITRLNITMQPLYSTFFHKSLILISSSLNGLMIFHEKVALGKKQNCFLVNRVFGQKLTRNAKNRCFVSTYKFFNLSLNPCLRSRINISHYIQPINL